MKRYSQHSKLTWNLQHKEGPCPLIKVSRALLHGITWYFLSFCMEKLIWHAEEVNLKHGGRLRTGLRVGHM